MCISDVSQTRGPLGPMYTFVSTGGPEASKRNKIKKIFGGIKNCYIFVPVKSLNHFNHG